MRCHCQVPATGPLGLSWCAFGFAERPAPMLSDLASQCALVNPVQIRRLGQPDLCIWTTRPTETCVSFDGSPSRGVVALVSRKPTNQPGLHKSMVAQRGGAPEVNHCFFRLLLSPTHLYLRFTRFTPVLSCPISSLVFFSVLVDSIIGPTTGLRKLRVLKSTTVGSTARCAGTGMVVV